MNLYRCSDGDFGAQPCFQTRFRNTTIQIYPLIEYPVRISPTGHLKCIFTSCFHYFRKTGSPPLNFLVEKKLKKHVILQISNLTLQITKLCLISVRTWLIVYCTKNRKSIPKLLSSKNLLKMNPSDFQFYPGKLANKNFLHMV